MTSFLYYIEDNLIGHWRARPQDEPERNHTRPISRVTPWNNGARLAYCNPLDTGAAVIGCDSASAMAAQLVPAAEIHWSLPWGKPLSLNC